MLLGLFAWLICLIACHACLHICSRRDRWFSHDSPSFLLDGVPCWAALLVPQNRCMCRAPHAHVSRRYCGLNHNPHGCCRVACSLFAEKNLLDRVAKPNKEKNKDKQEACVELHMHMFHVETIGSSAIIPWFLVGGVLVFLENIPTG